MLSLRTCTASRVRCGSARPRAPPLRPCARRVACPQRRIACFSAGGAQGSAADDSQGQDKSNKSNLPGFLQPLTDFGVGKKSVWEGGVGLFVLTAAGLAGALGAWVAGLSLNKGRGYECTIKFPEACSITVGTPVRLRGIQVGSVLNVQPHLDRVDVLVQLDDENTVVPRNSRIFANQSGLIAEPLVDIMPQHPIPTYSASPLSPECATQAAVVCNNGVIQGEKGVALDDLVYTCTQLMSQMDGGGMDAVIDAAKTVDRIASESQPLLDATTDLLGEVTPLLRELREAGIAQHIEGLAAVATETAGDIRDLEKAVLDTENVRELRRSIKTMTRTLQHIESIAGEVSTLSSDSGAITSLRQLIEAFSRLVAD